MSRVVFVSPTYVTKETRKAYKKHCQSIWEQDGDWIHVIVDDASPERGVVDYPDNGRVKYIYNKENEGSPLASTMKAIKAHANDDDIIAIVDGDDWLLLDNIVPILNSVYDSGVDLAWTNYLCSDGAPGHCQWIPEVIHPREQWFTSHLKTFKASLIKRIDDSVLRNGDGNYVRYAGDCALYWALLEKSFKRIHIPLLTYCYNVQNELSERRKSPEDVDKYTKMLQERRIHTRGQPTKRAMLDTGRVCNESCKFCYYAHEDCKKEFVQLKDLKSQLYNFKQNGREWIDLSGGEPSIHPDVKQVVSYAHELGLKVCMITNGLNGFDFDCDDYLVSLHGSKETHDASVGHPGSYDKIMAGLKALKESARGFRFNCVINKDNKDELPAIATIMAEWDPKIVNFINFNPYYNWSVAHAEDVQVSYSDFRDQLKMAIDILKAKGIGVNVRYVPFCQMKDYEKHVCNIMQHVFDDYEWLAKDMSSMEALNYANGIRQNNNSIQNNVCNVCAVQEICDGPNKQYAQRFGLKELAPYVNMPKFGAFDVLKFRFQYDEVFLP